MFLFIIGNFLLNPSFENWNDGNPENWFLSGTGINFSQELDTVYKDNYSCKVILQDTVTLWLYQRLPAKPDSIYNFTCFIYENDPAGRARWAFKFFLSDGTIQTQYGGSYTQNKPFWQYLSTGPITLPSNTDSIEVQIRFYDSLDVWDGNAEFFIDNLYLCYPAQDTTNVIINEIHYNPSTLQGGDSYFEFVEIFNPSFEDTINLTQFKLTDWDTPKFTFPAIELPPEEFIVIVSNMDSFFAETEYSDDFLNGNDQIIGPWCSIALGNSGDEVVLMNADSVTIDSVRYGTSSPWPTSPNGDGPSLELIDWTANNNNGANWGASNETYGTPGEINTITNPGPTIGKILRFPYIPYAAEQETIKSKIVDNNTVVSSKFLYWMNEQDIDSMVMTQGLDDTFYCVIPGQTNGTRLDSFFIKAIDNESKISYSDTTRGFFWGITDIQDIRVNRTNGAPLYSGYDVRVLGVVTAPESVFAVNYLLFYLQDGTSGIACHDPDPSKIQPIYENDSLEVIGTIVNFAGETQLKYIGDYITYLGSGNPKIPDTITISQMSEAYEGKLIIIQNVDTAYHSPWQAGVNTLDTISDFSKALGLIWIDLDTDIDGWGPDWGTNQNIKGILRQYDISSPYTSGYEISPRSQLDFAPYLGTFEILLNGYSEINYVNLFWHSKGEFRLFEIYMRKDDGSEKLAETNQKKIRLGPFDDGDYTFYVKGVSHTFTYLSNLINVSIISLKEGIYDFNFKDKISFTYVSHSEKKIQIKIIDISGRTVYESEEGVRPKKNFIKIDIKSLIRGIYFLHILDGNYTYIKKFTKIF